MNKEKVGKYQIKAFYKTGDSFGSQDTDTIVEISWDNLDIAKANLKRIQEHYEQYQKLESWRFSKEDGETILKNNETKDWFVKEVKDCVYYTDNQGKRNYNAISKKEIKKYQNNPKVEVGTFIDTGTAQNQIILYTDEGEKFQFWPNWCGYFESLQYAEIILDNSDLKFTV